MQYTATYSPEDNKLRLYASARLDKDEYDRVKAAGFTWAPKQELFVAPMWTPDREDLLVELAGEITDEDTSLVDRAEQRAERFEHYSDARRDDAHAARAQVESICEHIPLGQPILVGHHSERHARKDAERIQNGMRRSIAMWDQAEYWKSRAAGAVRAAKYKERPDVRARRIKKLEADKRGMERTRSELKLAQDYWSGQLKLKGGGFMEVNRDTALWFTNRCDHSYRCYPLDKYPRRLPASQYEGDMGLWSALGGSDGPDHAIITAEQARDLRLPEIQAGLHRTGRWIAHYENRLAYERAMLDASGGTVTDRSGPEKGGACRCWASRRDGWSLIQKVNKVSVTILDNWGNGGENFTRTIPFDKLAAVMTKAEVDQARAEGRVLGEDARGFGLLDKTDAPPAPAKPAVSQKTEEQLGFEALRAQAEAGVKVVVADQLFATPPDLAEWMVKLADYNPGNRILEPSAGTGNLVKAAWHHMVQEFAVGADMGKLVAVEINPQLADGLQSQFNRVDVNCRDFLECNGDLAQFDRVIMNPPFKNGADIEHIQHALTFLKPGGRLVALCANGPRQNAILRPMVEAAGGEWQELDDAFKEVGTGVRVALLVMDKAA